ncbi:DNA ligase D-like protein (predicted polymerase) [Tamaricihabitans halophyticus]|uniref:DNA ligase D-like protein (Predicted polymerase) n=1 Tax=Tamaricihabitans halophyticus TaxID=1262583 RepID=A0A4R2R636_9PSEU|nr:ATP-dependent DNA ligase [Tamaricihabitans halophyticus]TCP57504.1 DNA ligase D-like protein (predicted polymerase) [Tamaricihabitans halophyticus]
MGTEETRDGVKLTNLDQSLFEGAEATKRDLVDYLDSVHERIIRELRGRPLSVVRALRDQEPFMQKNLPKYTPSWVNSVRQWAATSQRTVRYALCDDRRTLLWFANQRAVEYHPALVRAADWTHATHLVLDIDPPADAFDRAVRAAQLVRQALTEAGLAGAVKTSGAKGVHIYVPVHEQTTVDDAAAATRALAARAERLDPSLVTTAYLRADRGDRVFLDATRAGNGTVVATYSPRVRAGTPVSWPVSWAELDRVHPSDFTVRTAGKLADPWQTELPAPQVLDADLLAEGHAIPIPRVQGMHEGKRRARAKRDG